jgi:hypothetical protein
MNNHFLDKFSHIQSLKRSKSFQFKFYSVTNNHTKDFFKNSPFLLLSISLSVVAFYGLGGFISSLIKVPDTYAKPLIVMGETVRITVTGLLRSLVYSFGIIGGFGLFCAYSSYYKSKIIEEILNADLSSLTNKEVVEYELLIVNIIKFIEESTNPQEFEDQKLLLQSKLIRLKQEN